MTSGPEHYREAERLAGAYKEAIIKAEAMPAETAQQFDERAFAAMMAGRLLDKAQVHATLAAAAATIEQAMIAIGHGDVRGDWQEVTR